MCLVLLLLIVPRRVQTSDMGSYGVTVGPAYPASLLLPVVGLVPLLRTYAECLPAGSEKPSSNILVVFLERRVHPFLSGCYTVYRSTTRKHFTNKTLQQPTWPDADGSWSAVNRCKQWVGNVNNGSSIHNGDLQYRKCQIWHSIGYSQWQWNSS